MDDELRAFSNTLMHYLVSINSSIKRGSAYHARLEIERLADKISNSPKRLEPFGYKVYSQNDEDGIIEEIFKRLNISKGSFCEIGVENGLECNTHFLLHKGWRGAWLEGNSNQQQPIYSKFHTLLNNKSLSVGIGYITPSNINDSIQHFLKAIDINPIDLDFLSIDIDGMDIYLFEALTLAPKVICIEYNSKFPPPIYKKPVYDENYRWTGTDFMGSSLTALNKVAEKKGYSLVATNFIGLNAFFVRNDLLEDRFNELLSPEALYNPPRYWLYDDFYSAGTGHRADFGSYVDSSDE